MKSPTRTETDLIQCDAVRDALPHGDYRRYICGALTDLGRLVLHPAAARCIHHDLEFIRGRHRLSPPGTAAALLLEVYFSGRVVEPAGWNLAVFLKFIQGGLYENGHTDGGVGRVTCTAWLCLVIPIKAPRAHHTLHHIPLETRSSSLP